ncbi:phage integrase SAM-like domain-containing protein [Staphylococcus sp. Marseille-Q1834]|uniref:phage integrase SAM-like domain-containing protein n=1 Tax=Staphylococcus sp. Marseille-Q1834 TaxID=2866594 RepID=UPI0012B6FA9B|nr:phage integrase SAM-like domain-containing protein [Staphylococcus sp. Marseille-Q1834]
MNLRMIELVDGYSLDKYIPFVNYYRKWLKVTKEDVVSEATYKRYLLSIKIFEECFGNIDIKDIDLISYRQFLKNYGKGLYGKNKINTPRTHSTVSKLHSCLRQGFQTAIEQGLIKHDPTINAKPLGYKEAQRNDEKYMNETELKNLIKYVKDKPYLSYLCVYILIITGSRFTPIRKMY